MREIGFESGPFDQTSGAMVAWYYHEEDDKAALSTKGVERPSLTGVGVSGLTGISNSDRASGEVNGARITIITDLPDHLYDMLTGDEVVLKLVYAGRHSGLNNTCVSVYPAAEYDAGELPNVHRKDVTGQDGTDGSNEERTRVSNYDIHQNSI